MENQAIKTIKLTNGNVVKIYHEEGAISPREYDNLGTIYSNHRDYDPDGHGMTEIIDMMLDKRGCYDTTKLGRDYVWLRIDAYIHGGISLSAKESMTAPLFDRWDSGIFGIIAVTKEKIRKIYNKRAVTKAIAEKVKETLKSEVEVLNAYLNGETYYFVEENANGEIVDTCCGYIGEEGLTTIESEYKSQMAE